MISDVITITSSGENMDAALRQADKVAVYKELSAKNTLHLRLLAEERPFFSLKLTYEGPSLVSAELEGRPISLL